MDTKKNFQKTTFDSANFNDIYETWNMKNGKKQIYLKFIGCK